MPTVIRKMEFDAGHRVLRHESKCKHLHGHRYVCLLHVHCRRCDMDGLGRVVDFGFVKEIVGKWIDDNLDHNTLLHPEDPLLHSATHVNDLVGRAPFIMPASMPNPTAENIAQVILWRARDLLYPINPIVKVIGIELYETPNCSVRIFDGPEPTET